MDVVFPLWQALPPDLQLLTLYYLPFPPFEDFLLLFPSTERKKICETWTQRKIENNSSERRLEVVPPISPRERWTGYGSRSEDWLHGYPIGLHFLDDGFETLYVHYRYGVRHREDGPALLRYTRQGTILEWWWMGKRHRAGGEAPKGPAIITPTSEIWYWHGLLHREDGPAVKTPEVQVWYYMGRRHRPEQEGPALIYSWNNYFVEKWYQNGRLHREGGPAVYKFDLYEPRRIRDLCRWYLDGILQKHPQSEKFDHHSIHSFDRLFKV